MTDLFHPLKGLARALDQAMLGNDRELEKAIKDAKTAISLACSDDGKPYLNEVLNIITALQAYQLKLQNDKDELKKAILKLQQQQDLKKIYQPIREK